MTEQILTGVGAELKQAREAAGLAIDQVAEKLRFAPRQIESLEHERFDRLPGPTIARGMVRNYARLLELDPEPLVARMGAPRNKVPEPGRIAPGYAREMPSSAGSRRSTRLYVGFSVLLLALVGAVVYQWWQEKAAAEFVAPVERTRPDQIPAQTKAAPAAKKPPAPAQQPAKKPAQQVASENPQPAPAEAPAKPKPEVAADSAVAPALHGLVLRMEEEAWLDVRDGAGRSLVSSLNPAGSERAVRGQPPFRLVIGNASHVELTYDGKPVDLKPYMRGEVARFTLK